MQYITADPMTKQSPNLLFLALLIHFAIDVTDDVQLLS